MVLIQKNSSKIPLPKYQKAKYKCQKYNTFEIVVKCQLNPLKNLDFMNLWYLLKKWLKNTPAKVLKSKIKVKKTHYI